MDYAAYATDWLKAHGSAEESMVFSLRAYFKSLLRRLDPLLKRGGNVDKALENVGIEIKQVLYSHLRSQTITGAQRELALVPTEIKLKAVSVLPWTKAPRTGKTPLPPEVMEHIDVFLDHLLNQPYWKDLGEGLREEVVDTIYNSIQEGKDPSKALESLLGAGSKSRAKRIARTETTGAMNYGAQAVRDELGLVPGVMVTKEWLDVEDARTRKPHREANGQIVAYNEHFDVGGERAMYPGDPKLSPGNRINCRCTAISHYSLA